MPPTPKGTPLITVASSGIGSVYADRLARRGYDVILVARDRDRLDALAGRLAADTGCSARIMVADLTAGADLARVEHAQHNGPGITALVNSAGIGDVAPVVDSDIHKMDQMVALNVTALMHLTHAVVPGFLKRACGAIVNVASVVDITPELLNGVYGGTKAFVLAFTRSLHKELGRSGIREQAVLPGATATPFWAIAGTALEQLPTQIVMKARDVVDAALAGFDPGEVITIPSPPDIGDWEAYEAARQKMIPKLSLSSPAPRYELTYFFVSQRKLQ